MKRFHRLIKGCLGIGCAGPFILLIVLFVTFSFNNRKPTILIPTPILPPNNGYDDFVLAGQMIKTITHKAPAAMQTPPSTREAYIAQTKAGTEESATALTILRNGFSKPYASPPERSINAISLSTGAMFREVARTMSGVKEYYELTGQPGKAIDVALDCAEMGITIPHGAGLILDMVGMAVESIALDRFEPLLPLLSDKELAQVAARLETIAGKRVLFADIVQEEGCIATAFNRDALRDPRMNSMKAYYDSIYSSLRPEDGSRANIKEAWHTTRFALMNKTAALQEVLRYYREKTAEAKKPFTLKSTVKPIAGPLGEALDFIDEDVTQNTRAHHLSRVSTLNIIRIEVALLRYRGANGRLPKHLTELSPTFLSTVPMDPLTGAANLPYRYSISNSPSGFLLYGVGPDMVDHGGKPGKFAGDSGYDIVAGRISRSGRLFP